LAELGRDPIINLCSANNKSSKRLGIECPFFNAIYTKYCRKYRYRRASCSRDMGLHIFIKMIVGYIDLGRLNAPVIGGINIL
jgi:hypothetical protein